MAPSPVIGSRLMTIAKVVWLRETILLLENVLQTARETHENKEYLSRFPHCIRHTLRQVEELKQILPNEDYAFLAGNLGYFFEVCGISGQYPLLTADQKRDYRKQTLVLVQILESFISRYTAELRGACIENGIDFDCINGVISWLEQKLAELYKMERDVYDPAKLTIKLGLWDKRTIEQGSGFGLNLLVENFSTLRVKVNYKRPQDLKEMLKDRNSLFKAILEDVRANPNLYQPRNGNETAMTKSDNSSKNKHSVFIVHGRDEKSRFEVEAFLHKLDIEPIVLFQQPSGNRTVIEKFEFYSDVQFAVVILNGEDTGFLKAAYNDIGTDGERENGPTEDRARQNVIFELGYFLGKLGRGRVAALMMGKVKGPSDYEGVVYIPMNAGQWKIDLANEMSHSGLDIDMNKLR